MTKTGWMFTLATLCPAMLLLLAGVFGALWGGVALAYMTVFTFTLDRTVAVSVNKPVPDREFPAANRLSVALALTHFGLLWLAVLLLAHGFALNGTPIGTVGWIVLFLAFGQFFGQISNSNAHELIHRTDKRLFYLGQLVYSSLLFGHHVSAHRRIHHPYAASGQDPNSARLGESFYHFAPRAWVGSFRAGYRAEAALLHHDAPQSHRRKSALVHPYIGYAVVAGASIGVAALSGGGRGVLVLLGLAFYAQMQLLLSDYVQHYGLQRARRADGRLERLSPRHSWNAPQWFSNYVMLAAPRHSDHHTHPAKPYPALTLPVAGQAPLLPFSLPVMALVALSPAHWRRLMDHRARKWPSTRAEPKPNASVA